MKGTGLSTGSMGGGVAVGISNAGARGAASMRIGGGSSIERGMSGGTSAFSSRGLSMFNREAISKPSSSIINPNFGKGAKSPHARTPGLASPRGMFDVSRPVRARPVSRPAEFGVKLNTKNGLERTSKTTRSINLAPKGIFDITRPVRVNSSEGRVSKPAQRNFEFGKRITPARSEEARSPRLSEIPLGKSENRAIHYDKTRTVAARTREAGLNPGIRSERVKSISPFKDTIILWQRKDASPRIRPETVKRPVRVVEKDTQKIVEQFRKISLRKEVFSVQKPQTEAVYKVFKAKQEVKIKLKKEKVQKIKRRKVGNIISVLPEVQDNLRDLIHANIHKAQNDTIPAIINARRVSYQEAMKEAVEILAKEYKGKVKIKTIPQVKPEVQPALESNTQNASSPQVHVKPEQSKKPEPNALKAQNPKGKGLEFYFQKDKTANKNRIEAVLATASKLLKDKKEKKEVIGKDVAGMIKDEGHLRSEVVRVGSLDGSLDNFKNEVAKIGKIEEIRNLRDVVLSIAEKFTGVKLSLRRSQNDGATKKHAQDVYKASLNGKEGYFQEYGATTGDFVENNQKLHFVPNSVLRSAAVV